MNEIIYRMLDRPYGLYWHGWHCMYLLSDPPEPNSYAKQYLIRFGLTGEVR